MKDKNERIIEKKRRTFWILLITAQEAILNGSADQRKMKF
jgi:hypothetical protein